MTFYFKSQMSNHGISINNQEYTHDICFDNCRADFGHLT